MFVNYLTHHKKPLEEQDRAGMTYFCKAIQRRRKNEKIFAEAKPAFFKDDYDCVERVEDCYMERDEVL
jgi:hypothetical protein